MANDIGKLVSYIEKQGVKVDKDMKQVLAYFIGGQVLVSFFPVSGHGASPNSYISYLSKYLDLDAQKTSQITRELERLHILGEERGLSSPGGSEYEYGFTEVAQRIYKK